MLGYWKVVLDEVHWQLACLVVLLAVPQRQDWISWPAWQVGCCCWIWISRGTQHLQFFEPRVMLSQSQEP
jgi:hypothetical protein